MRREETLPIVFFAGLLGAVLLTMPIWPGEIEIPFLGRALPEQFAIAAGYFALAGVLVGYKELQGWWRAIYVTWGAVLLVLFFGGTAAVATLQGNPPERDPFLEWLALTLAMPVVTSLIGGVVGYVIALRRGVDSES